MKCECVKCEACNGTGDIWVDIFGNPTVHCDDTDYLESCSWCDGTGYEDGLCDYCRLMEEEFEY